MSSPLPPTSFRAGDRVIGTDRDGTHFGEVQATPASVSAEGKVLVRWADDESESDAAGTPSSAELLRLWPARTHAARARARR